MSSRSVLGQQNPAAATDGTLLTVPASGDYVVSTITVTETNGVATTFKISVRGAGGTTTTAATAIAFGTPVGANQALAVTVGITLQAAGTIVVQSASGNVTFTAFGQANP